MSIFDIVALHLLQCFEDFKVYHMRMPIDDLYGNRCRDGILWQCGGLKDCGRSFGIDRFQTGADWHMIVSSFICQFRNTKHIGVRV